jgi:hypothetical protein
MEVINYASAMLWYALWPVIIWISYKFIVTNIEHLEENIETKPEK